MQARFRVGAEIANFFNPGAPYTNIVIAQITDAFFEVQYLENGQAKSRVFPWASSQVTHFEVVSD